MLAERPAPDRKRKFITSSFITLPYLSDCLICTRNVIPNLLLLQIWEDGIAGGAGEWLIESRMEVGGQGLSIILQFFLHVLL